MPGFIGQSDLSDLSDRKPLGRGKNSIPLSALAARWRAGLDHDEAEARAMAEHYAASVVPDPAEPDPLRDGLLRGFHEHRARLTGR
ncbi:hypothetical protein [Roseomonas sp. WA12]